MEVTFLVFLTVVGMVYSDPDCTLSSLNVCTRPIMQYSMSDEGRALLAVLGPSRADASTLSDNQIVQACVANTNAGLCLADLYRRCSTGTDREVSAVMDQIAQMGKKCYNPDVGAKGRKLLTCGSKLMSASSTLASCSIEMDMFGLTMTTLQPSTGVVAKNQVDQQLKNILRNFCKKEESNHKCSIVEIRRVCNEDEVSIYEDLRAAMSDSMNCQQLTKSGGNTNHSA
ncbi:hypothetical protein RvY_02150 [Ramazzottius varieornatus]|uniref:DUF19 domain-containing protein n=1 Tax=Ramazzottius varieornatus TaxID=947166 RepID=A0A1D1UM44_RAMVA|nr:hypothetical protein RvY_02150 [Ramazzottius varieornatus]